MRFFLSLLWTLQLLNFANDGFLTGLLRTVTLHEPRPPLRSPVAAADKLSVRTNVSVAIIGAGFAGLSAFRRLAEIGFTNVHLFEGSHRLGGRVLPLNFEGVSLEQGAEFINGRNNPIYAIASRLHLIVGEADDAQLLSPDHGALFGSMDPRCAVPTNRLARFAGFSADLEARYAQLAATNRSMWRVTIGELFNKDYADFLSSENGDGQAHFDSLAGIYRSYYEGEWAAPVDKLALHNYAIWRDAPGDISFSSFTLNLRGYAAILEELVEGIPQDRLHIGHRVLNINYGNENGVRLWLKSTGPWPKLFDFVIVTVPIGHLKRFNSALFTPPLPAVKMQIIQAIGFGAMQKVFLVYERPFWTRSMSSLVAMSCAPHDGLQTALRTMQPHPWKENVMVVWLSGKGPRLINALSDQKLADLVTDQLSKMLPNLTVPQPKRIIRTKWLDDDLFLGSYTFISPEASALSADPFGVIAAPVHGAGGKLRLFFAGEGTHSTMYQTTVGAFLSGQREANRLSRYISTNGW